jgi:sarcosine oxidase gamma subunit
MSDGFAVFRLQGNGSPWLLCKLSGLDFLAGRAAGQHCARTKLGQVAVVIHYHQAENKAFVFDLLVDRSYARYLWELLAASAPHADELALTFGAAA